MADLSRPDYPALLLKPLIVTRSQMALSRYPDTFTEFQDGGRDYVMIHVVWLLRDLFVLGDGLR